MRPTVPSEALELAAQLAPPALPASPALPAQAGPAQFQLGSPQMAQQGAGLPPQLAAVLAAQQSQMNALAQAIQVMGAQGGPPSEDPPIRELPAPRSTVVKCDFCHSEHEATFKCAARKQALRLKSDWDKEQATARNEAEAAAKQA